MQPRRRLKNSPLLKICIVAVAALIVAPLAIASTVSPVEAIGSLLCVGTLLPFSSKADEIAKLQTENTDLKATVEKHGTEKAGLESQVQQLTTERDAQAKLVADEKARADQLATDLKAANDKAAADLKAAQDKHAADLKAAEEAAQTKIAEEVNNRLAAAGVDPIARDPKAAESEGGKTPPALTGIAKSRAALQAKLDAKTKAA